ncbi:MAG: PAS domain S-box protein, partial [Candidatus Saccharimonadales bacterium]
MKAKTDFDYAGQQALAEATFNSIGDGAITTDEYGNITRFNPMAQKILEYEEAEALGEYYPKLLGAFDNNELTVPLIDRPITRALVSGKIISETIHYKTKSGQLIPVSLTISPILVKDNPIGIIGIFRDITKEYETDKMKSDFISLASHQLRT